MFDTPMAAAVLVAAALAMLLILGRAFASVNVRIGS